MCLILKKYFNTIYGTDMKKHIFFIIRVVIILMIVGFMLCVFPLNKISFHKYYNFAKGLSAWENYEIINLVNANVEQPFYSISERLEEISFFVTEIESDKSFAINYLLQDEDANIIEQGNVQMTEANNNQYVTISINSQLKINENYSLILNLDKNNPSISCSVVFLPTELAPEHCEKAYINETNATTILASNYTYKVPADKRETAYSFFLATISIIALLFWEYMVKSKRFRYSLLIMISEVAIMLSLYCEKFSTIIEGNEILKTIYIIFCILIILVSIYQLYGICVEKNNKPEQFFVISTLVWGIIYMILLPPFSTHDELTHFSEANAIANNLTNIEARNEQGHVYLRTEDAIDYERYLKGYWMVEYYSNVFSKAENPKEYQTLEYFENKGIMGLASHAYAPFALAIIVGRALNLNYVGLMTLGTMFGLLLYIVLVYQAIKITPIGKWSFYILSQIPTVFQIITGYTYDLLNMATIFLTIAYFFYLLYQKEKIGIKQFVLFALLCIVWCPIKIAYFPLCFVIFLLPQKKIELTNIQAYLCKTAVVVSGLIATCSQRFGEIIYGFTNRKTIPQTQTSLSLEQIIESTVTGSKVFYTVQDLLEDKFKIIWLIVNTLYEKIDFYWRGMFGTYLGWSEITIPNYLVDGFLILVVASFLVQNHYNQEATSNQKTITYLIGIACCGAIVAGLIFNYTPNNLNYILGIQPRYFLVLLPLFVIILSNKKCYFAKDAPAWIWVMGGSFLNMLAVFRIYYVIIAGGL